MAAARISVCVLGAHGNLGSEIVHLLRSRWVTVDAYGHEECDIIDSRQVRVAFDKSRPTVVVNSAAYTNVDGAETESEKAFDINALGPEIVSHQAIDFGARLISFSTDFVFDGRRDGPPYTENDIPNPQSTYAKSKLAGEKAILSADSRFVVLRVGNLFGIHGGNFPSTLMTRLRRGEALSIDAERRMSPTWSRAVAEQVYHMIVRNLPGGLYHATCNGETTWAGFASELCSRLGLPKRFEAVSSDALRLKAQRPRYHVLENLRLAKLGHDYMPHWMKALSGYLSVLPS
jgi:dTDP-4-dehydrorhamnose reductase